MPPLSHGPLIRIQCRTRCAKYRCLATGAMLRGGPHGELPSNEEP
jgi:hypothetical protein